MRLYSRRGHEWTQRLPGLVEALLALPCEAAVLDGELCLPDKKGAPDFKGLHGAFGARPHELAVFVFDLPYRDRADLTGLPLIERRRRLVRLISRAEIPCLHLLQSFEDGAALFAAAKQHGLEGVVSKRKDAPYRSGPSRDWVKVKTLARLASGSGAPGAVPRAGRGSRAPRPTFATLRDTPI